MPPRKSGKQRAPEVSVALGVGYAVGPHRSVGLTDSLRTSSVRAPVGHFTNQRFTFERERRPQFFEEIRDVVSPVVLSSHVIKLGIFQFKPEMGMVALCDHGVCLSGCIGQPWRRILGPHHLLGILG